MAQLKSGDQVRVIAGDRFVGMLGEVFKTDLGDEALPYKAILDCGLSWWFGPDELEPA